MIKLLVVGIGGFVGAVARYGVSGLVHRFSGGTFPAGTLVVNVLGCLSIGALMALVEDRQSLSPNARMLIMVGFLGSFTTFSALGYETLELLRESDLRRAFLNVAANLVLGIGAVWLGRAAVGIGG